MTTVSHQVILNHIFNSRTDSVGLPGARRQTIGDDVDEELDEDEYVCDLLWHITGLTGCPVRFSQRCRLGARWINLAICFGVELQDVFKIGMRLNVTEEYDSDSDTGMYAVEFSCLFCHLHMTSLQGRLREGSLSQCIQKRHRVHPRLEETSPGKQRRQFQNAIPTP